MRITKFIIPIFIFLSMTGLVFAVIDWSGTEVKGFYNYQKLNSTHLKDWSPSDNPAQLYGVGEEINIFEKYINFTGTYWYVTDKLTGLNVDSKTLCAWLKTTQDTGTVRFIITTGIKAPDNLFSIYIDGGEDWMISQFGASLVATRPPIETDTLFCGLYHGSNNYEIYFNSTSQISGSMSTSYVDDVTVLGDWDILGGFPLVYVNVYSFMVFDRNLTSTEIGDLSAQGRFYNPYTPTPPIPSPTPQQPDVKSTDILVNIAGSKLFLGLVVVCAFLIILLLVRASKEVMLIIAALMILGLIDAAIFPKWILVIVLIFIGLILGGMFVRQFFRQY